MFAPAPLVPCYLLAHVRFSNNRDTRDPARQLALMNDLRSRLVEKVAGTSQPRYQGTGGPACGVHTSLSVCFQKGRPGIFVNLGFRTSLLKRQSQANQSTFNFALRVSVPDMQKR